MNNQLFIPQKLKVGFQKREDTYTGKLAYVICYDEQGKLRKEYSWEGWRDKKIEPQEYGNEPTSGFVINKDIQRYNWSHFSSGRSMIRIYDPRGFEFEISPNNLTHILMHTDCLRRGLEGNFVYSWSGKDLVLLSEKSEEYVNSIKFTELKSKKVTAAELKEGYSYITKKQETWIYLGKFDYHHRDVWHYYRTKKLPQKEKFLIFVDEKGLIFPKKNKNDLAEINSDQIVSNYAELVDKYLGSINGGAIVKFEVRKTNKKTKLVRKNNFYDFEEFGKTYSIEGNVITCKVLLQLKNKYVTQHLGIEKDSYFFVNAQTYHIDSQTKQVYSYNDQIYRFNYSGYNNEKYTLLKTPLTLKEVEELDFYDLWVTLDNGKELKVDISEL